eukprot:SAG11_NODE_594_length_8302_cov_1.386810_1_plen_176_part_00
MGSSGSGSAALLLVLLAACRQPATMLTSAVAAAAEANICATNASIGHAVIGAVNLSWPGMNAVRTAAADGDLGGACEALAAYYRDGNTSAWLRLLVTPAPSTRRAGGEADDLVNHDIFHLSGVGQVAKIPRNRDGGIDWLNHGPKNDPYAQLPLWCRHPPPHPPATPHCQHVDLD